MVSEIEVIDFLRGVFADGAIHSTGELCKLLSERFGFSSTQAMRRVMSLYSAGEICKVKRGLYQRVSVDNLEEHLYKILRTLKYTIESSLSPEMDTSDFSDSYKITLHELIGIWIKVNEVLNKLEEEM